MKIIEYNAYIIQEFDNLDIEELINEDKELEMNLQNFISNDPIIKKVTSMHPSHLSSALNLINTELYK